MSTAVILIPVKAFGDAKQRLSAEMDPDQRAELAEWMATEVLRAAAPLPTVIVCDDPGVRRWAKRLGASISWTPGLGLNGALEQAARDAALRGAERIVLAHADLPFARGFSEFVDGARENEVVICPDRHRDGTNVLSVPTRPVATGLTDGYGFAYGPGSFDAHVARFASLGLAVTERVVESLTWDIDRAQDLDPPRSVGVMPQRFRLGAPRPT
jgi:2-phospho-L-lactate guanylyltransferase